MARRIVAWLALVLACAPTASAQEFFFKKGDRIVFLGDSITEQYQYSTYIELYLTTRFPDWNLAFSNAGIGGDSANGGANRFKKHVLGEKPTAVTINFGMNDGGYGKFDEKRNALFVEKTKAMLEMSKQAEVRVALLSPNAVDPRAQPKMNFKLYLETQKEFYAPLAGLAKEHGATFVDQYGITRAAQEKMQKDDPTASKAKPYYDGFHTSPPGALLMAHAILTGLKAPAEVSAACLDPSGKVLEARGCKIMQAEQNKSGGISFKRLDAALPMPMQKDWAAMLPYLNDMRDLNDYALCVKDLPHSRYTLLIDGQPVGDYSNKQLGEGINVGLALQGPVRQQGQKVLTAIQAKNKLVHDRFRGGVMANAEPDTLAVQRMLIDTLQTEVYKLAQPTARTWELVQGK